MGKDKYEIMESLDRKLEKLIARQDEICDRIGRIEARIGGEAELEKGAASKAEVLRFLDAFRAGEALGEASLGAWIEVSTTACLKGGLRTIQCREGMHARLLEQRLKELGGSPKAEVPEAVYEATMQGAASRDKSDAAKVLEFMQRFPDADEALRPIDEIAKRLDHDPETQSLLRTIMQDERSTLEFLGEACALLNG